MKSLSFIALLALLVSCSGEKSSEQNKEQVQANTRMDFKTAFSGADTTKTGLTVGCSSGEYKLINDKYVLHIKPYFREQFDSCFAVDINSINANQIVELMVFDNNKSSLSNICTDVVSSETAEPSRRLNAESGSMVVGYSDPIELSGKKTSRISVLVKNIVFVDEKTGEKVELKNELLWKVLDIGTAG